MTKLTLISLFVLPLITKAQVELENVSLQNPSLAILYKGGDNILSVSGLRIDSNSLNITSATGQISPGTKLTEFLVRPGHSSMDTLRLYRDSLLIMTKFFEVKRLGVPILQFGYINDTTATIEEMLELPKLIVSIPDCHYSLSSHVIRFTTQMTQQNGDTIMTFQRTNGNQIPETQIKYLEELVAGDKVTFSEVIRSCSSSSQLEMEPLSITITD